MKAHCLGSSSDGNCFIIELDGAKPIMVECGVGMRDLAARRMMSADCPSLADISICLITHSHGDHCKSARAIDDMGIGIYGSEETIGALGIGTALETMKPNRIGDIAILPFPVNHDCAGSVGFAIKSSKETIIFINDCKGWPCDISSFKPDYVFIECNHWAKQCHAVRAANERIMSSQPLGSKEFRKAKQENDLLCRNLDFHMSLEACERNLGKINLSKCKGIFLMHGSERYLDKLGAKMRIADRLGIKTFIAHKEGGFR